MTTTATRPAELRRMAASVLPTTINETAKTIELVIASDAPIDGLSLVCTREAVQFGPAPVPVLLSHSNTTDKMAGRITQLRFERGQVIGTAQFTDAPAADEGWQLARAGCAVSVGARIDPAGLRSLNREADQATRWRLLEASLVPVGADPRAVTRSFNQAPEGVMSTTTTAAPAAVQITESPELSRTQLIRQNKILHMAREAQLSDGLTRELIASDRPLDEVAVQVFEVVRSRLSQSNAGHPVTGAVLNRAADADPLASAIEAAYAGQPINGGLLQVLRDSGYGGRNASEIVRNAFVTGRRSGEWLQRGFHSTSDAKDLLLSTGDRRLQERHTEAPRGILELARIRQLADFREASVIDAGLVGGAVKIEEGGEVKFGSLESEAGKYKPSRYELGLSFTFEALANDDLGGLSAVTDEISATMLEAEAAQLGDLLHGSGGAGGICPDGLALFNAAHNNVPGTAATLSVDGLGAMVQLLRGQTSVGGRKIWLNPGYVLVGPDLETTALQLLSEAWDATSPDDTNPWKSLRLIVDPTVEPTYFYLVASGARKPFELGRVAGMPTMTSEDDFSTSGMRVKVTHAFGAACIDFRTIVRNK